MAFKCDEIKKGRLQKRFLRLMFCLSLMFFMNVQETLSRESKEILEKFLLLPACQKKCNNVYGRISIEEGCYSWEIERKDLLEIEKINLNNDTKGCYSQVLVIPKTNSGGKYSYIMARESNSSNYFKYKVGLAYPKSISIQRQFDSLNIGEYFELHVVAYDEKGHLFSSLEGWKFKWQIIEGREFAEIKKLRDNARRKSQKGRIFAEESAFSDIIIIEGKKEGRIKIKVEIMEDEFKHVINSDILTLFVIDPSTFGTFYDSYLSLIDSLSNALFIVLFLCTSYFFVFLILKLRK